LGDVVRNQSDRVLVINVAQQSPYALDYSFPNQAIFWQRFHNHTSGRHSLSGKRLSGCKFLRSIPS